MAAPSLTFLLRCLRSRHNPQTSGFTFIELLVVVVIAGMIISGLLYLVVELLGVDQREASRNETQREMQLAMDYISNELRQAVYVYSGACLAGEGDCPDDFTEALPDALTDESVPILAFWKQQPIPTALREGTCTADYEPDEDAPIEEIVPCTSASSYALVVYSLSTKNDGNIWKGRARITRYAMTQFQTDGDPTPGYVMPLPSNFGGWPYGNDPALDGTPAVLVDYVDDATGADFLDDDETANVAACPGSYLITPSDDFLADNGFDGVRSFYACIDPGTTTENRDVVVYLRGNAFGRPGTTGEATFLPTLETRVLSRGVLDRNPDGNTPVVP